MHCPSDFINLYEWIQTVAVADLPPAPFKLHKGVIVIDAQKFLESLQADAGPNHPRAAYGALQDDLRELRNLLKSKNG
ncbi:hypothetical protein JXA32_16475 [Candidatus Sumerlaeota bacterium]|nr:hypothetical protein [Candidatus Sumerlaeota bacterium]